MRGFPSRPAGLALGLILLTLTLSGCFQTGGEALPPTALGVVPQATIQPTVDFVAETQIALAITQTFMAGITSTQPPTQVGVPTQIPTQLASQLPTLTPLPALPTETPFIPTETPFVFPTATATAVPTLFIPTLQPTVGAPFQPSQTPPLGPTNTLLIPTLTGPAATQPPPPTIEPVLPATVAPAPATETQQALELTATFFIQSAQNTLAAAATHTATALGTGLPPGVVLTATPTLPRGTVRITGTPQGTPGAPGSGAAGTITGDCIYTVVSGDRMFRIALRFNTTPADIARANGIININLINPGQQLRIPNCNVTPPPAVTPTPTFGQGGPTTSVPPIVTATRSAGSGQVYTVQRGDTLFSISLRYRVTVAAMAQANNIANPALIYPGQKLTIP